MSSVPYWPKMLAPPAARLPDPGVEPVDQMFRVVRTDHIAAGRIPSPPMLVITFPVATVADVVTLSVSFAAAGSR